MAIFSLVCVLLPPLVALVLVGFPAVLDLVMREERVPLWWAAPFAMFIPFVFIGLVTPAMMDPGMEQVALTMLGWGMLHLAAAGMLLALATGLAFARGLRPGGDAERRRRTSLVAIGVLLGFLFLPWLPRLGMTFWVVPPAWAGLFWVIGLNRRGPQRLERGKSVASALLFASAISFLIGAALLLRGFELAGEWFPMPTPAWIASLLGLALMAGGLRYLTGPPAPGPLLAAATSGISLLVPGIWWLAFDPVPAGISVPQWVDFEGNRGPPTEPYGTHRCLPIIAPDGTQRLEGPRCDYGSWNEATLVDARTPLDRIPLADDSTSFLVGDGTARTNTWRRYGNPIRVVATGDGQALLVGYGDGNGVDIRGKDGRTSNLMLYGTLARENPGPALSRAIRTHAGDNRPLIVSAYPDWTMQDFVSMCASMGAPMHCQLVKYPF